MIDKILQTFEKSYHMSYNQDFICCVGSSVNLYDIKTGILIHKFKDIKNPNYSKFASNQTLVVKTTAGIYHVYNLNSMNLIKIISPPKKVLGSTTNFQITSDNKYIIDFSYVFPIKRLMIINIETEEYVFFDLGYARKGFIFSTEINSKYYVIVSCAQTIDSSDVSVQDFYELTYTLEGFKLQKLFDNHIKVSVADYSSNRFAIANYSNDIILFDINNDFQDNFQYNKNDVLYDLKLSPNGDYIALIESQYVYVYALNNKKCVKKYNVENGSFVDFLDDTKLLIGTWEKGYCVSW